MQLDAEAIRDKRREERFYERVRSRDTERKWQMDRTRKYAYYTVGMALVCTLISSGSAWTLVFMYADDLKPYDIIMWIFAVAMSMFVCLTSCCTWCAIYKEYVGVYFFYVAVLFCAFFCLLVAVFGMVMMKYNEGILFYKVDDTLKTILVWAYFGGGVAGFVFLFISGLIGLHLNSYTKENYFGRKSKVQWCPNLAPDMEVLEAEAEARKQRRLDALPKSDMYEDDFKSYKTSFQGIMDLQQGLNDRDEKNFFVLQDLSQALPDVPMIQITLKSADKTVDYQAQLRERPCRGKLLPSKTHRQEPFFTNVWGTALALALLKSKLPDWCQEELQMRRNIKAKDQLEIFNKLLRDTTTGQIKEWEEQGGLRESSGTEEVTLDVEEGAGTEEEALSPSKSEDAEFDVNKTVFWIKPIRLAVFYLNSTILIMRKKFPEIKSDATDWVSVADDVVRDWTASKKSR